jgi:hypothetical protein
MKNFLIYASTITFMGVAIYAISAILCGTWNPVDWPEAAKLVWATTVMIFGVSFGIVFDERDGD